MKIKEFKYVFLDIGGGWGTIHSLYGVTKAGEVYSTDTFDEKSLSLDTEINCELEGKLNSIKLGLQPRRIVGIMDASYLTVLDVEKNLKVVYRGDEHTDNNPVLFNRIKQLIRENYHRKVAQSMNYKYIVRTESLSVYANALTIQNNYCWIEELSTLYRVLEADSELQPDAIVYEYENEQKVCSMCKVGRFDNSDTAFQAMKHNVVMVQQSLSQLNELYGDSLEDEDDVELSQKLDVPKTYLACYMFNYFGGDCLDGKIIDGAGIDVAFRPYKNGKLVQFRSEAETCVKLVMPSRIIEEGRKETIYFSDLVSVAYDRNDCYKLTRNEELIAIVCEFFGWDKIDIEVENVYLFYKERDFLSAEYECGRDVFEEFLKSRPDDFDIADNKNAQCPAYGWADK